MTDMLQAALQYADREWKVFPLYHMQDGRCSCGRACSQPGKHPMTPNGFYNATNDPDTIINWWTNAPRANIGIRTGKASNLWVLDIDTKRSVDLGRGVLVPEGEHTLRTLEDRAGETVPETLTSLTGGGGTHYLFTYPEDADKYKNRVGVAPSIDVRGESGYIVAPPSNHASGKTYRWVDETEPVSKAPSWILALQDDKEDGGFTECEEVAEGSRNEYLFKYAAKLRGEGRDGNEFATLVMAHNLMVCKPPLDRGEVVKIVHNVLANYQPNPQEAEFVWDTSPEVPEIEDGEDVFLSLRDLALNPPPPKVPLIHDGILDRGDGFILAGVSGAGKSWMMFDMGLAIATGTPWLGRFNTEQSTVLYIDEEAGVSSTWTRLQMMQRGRGINPLVDDIPFYLSCMHGIKLDSPKGMTIVARALERYRPGLVIFDALVRFHDGDENSTKDMAHFFDRAKTLKEAYDVSFAFLHHVRKPSKDDGADPMDSMRGSSDVRGWPDSAMIIKPNDDHSGVIVAHGKSRNHAQLTDFEVGRVIDEQSGIASLAYRGEVEKEASTPEQRRAQILEVVERLQGTGAVETTIIASRTGMAERTVLDHLRVLQAEEQVISFKLGGKLRFQIAPLYSQKGMNDEDS